MRRLSIGLIWAVLALSVAISLMLALAVESAPRVPHREAVSAADVDRVVAIVRQHDPRRAPALQLRTLSLSEHDVDLLVHHAARRWLGANTQVGLQPGRLSLQASLAAPWGRWLNAELVLRQAPALPEVERLRIGRLPLPAALAMPLLRTLATTQGVPADALLALRWIEGVNMTGGRMWVRYRIDPDTVPRLRASLVAPADQQRLRAYAERLALLTHGVESHLVSMSWLMSQLFTLAAERTAAGGNAVAENRAALLTLTFFASQRPLGLMVPAAYQWPRAKVLIVTLRERQDFALHFLVSALIAAEAGTPLADAVGLWKELDDARRGGSGFSFNDLAADRAGTRLGELAVREPVRLQARIAAGVVDADLMPEVGDLPEHLPQSEFLARFGGVGGAAYTRMLAKIDARIEALPMLH